MTLGRRVGRVSFSTAVRCLLVVALAACAGAPARSPSPGTARFEEVRRAEGRPPVAVLARDGDPSAAVAVSVLTLGVDPAHGAEVPVALSGIVEARLFAAGVRDVSVVPGAEGFRVRALVPTPADARLIVSALREALTTPVADKGPEVDAAARKLAALARLPIPDPALRIAVECAGDPVRRKGSKVALP